MAVELLVASARAMASVDEVEARAEHHVRPVPTLRLPCQPSWRESLFGDSEHLHIALNNFAFFSPITVLPLHVPQEQAKLVRALDIDVSLADGVRYVVTSTTLQHDNDITHPRPPPWISTV
jgi:hypothetical protein